MSRNTYVCLSDHFTEFLTRQVASGRHGSACEVVRAGLRLPEECETALEALRADHCADVPDAAIMGPGAQP